MCAICLCLSVFGCRCGLCDGCHSRDNIRFLFGSELGVRMGWVICAARSLVILRGRRLQLTVKRLFFTAAHKHNQPTENVLPLLDVRAVRVKSNRGVSTRMVPERETQQCANCHTFTDRKSCVISWNRLEFVGPRVYVTTCLFWKTIYHRTQYPECFPSSPVVGFHY